MNSELIWNSGVLLCRKSPKSVNQQYSNLKQKKIPVSWLKSSTESKKFLLIWFLKIFSQDMIFVIGKTDIRARVNSTPWNSIHKQNIPYTDSVRIRTEFYVWSNKNALPITRNFNVLTKIFPWLFYRENLIY